MKPFYNSKNIVLYNENTFDVLDLLIKQDKKFDTIFADPPYFLSNDGITCINGKMIKVNKGALAKGRGEK